MVPDADGAACGFGPAGSGGLKRLWTAGTAGLDRAPGEGEAVENPVGFDILVWPCPAIPPRTEA